MLPTAGWYCFGCQRGGSIIDSGAALDEVQPIIRRAALPLATEYDGLTTDSVLAALFGPIPVEVK